MQVFVLGGGVFEMAESYGEMTRRSPGAVIAPRFGREQPFRMSAVTLFPCHARPFTKVG